MKSLKIKLMSIISIFVLALSMLIIGVWAVGETQCINLSGNVDFTISEGLLYIKDIRMKDADDTINQGTTIDNFIPGFVQSNFQLNLGSFNATSNFDLVIDVVNTSTTIYEVNTNYDITNASVNVSGRIEGDGVPLAEVATADISGQIILNVTITSAGTVSIDQVDISLTEHTPIVYDYFTFSVNSDNKTVTLTDYDSSLSDSTDIVIPSKVSQNSSGQWIEGSTYIVTAIANRNYNTGVFYNSDEIISVELPSTLQIIGDYAFNNCSGLTSITFPSSLTSIGKYAFCLCSELTGELDLSGCKSLIDIGEAAFDRCNGITNVNLSGCTSLTSIGYRAFYACIGPAGEGKLDISGCTSLISIGEQAFYYCDGLISVDLRGCTSLTSIGNSTFSSCSVLTNVDLSGCTSLTSIGRGAFGFCVSLNTVTFPNTTGWYVTTSSTEASVTDVDVTAPEVNADNLSRYYYDYYWKRNV